MQTNRRQSSSVASPVEAQAHDKVRAIRESLATLKTLTAEESELKTLTYLIGMALQEAGAPRKA